MQVQRPGAQQVHVGQTQTEPVQKPGPRAEQVHVQLELVPQLLEIEQKQTEPVQKPGPRVEQVHVLVPQPLGIEQKQTEPALKQRHVQEKRLQEKGRQRRLGAYLEYLLDAPKSQQHRQLPQ